MEGLEFVPKLYGVVRVFCVANDGIEKDSFLIYCDGAYRFNSEHNCEMCLYVLFLNSHSKNFPTTNTLK